MDDRVTMAEKHSQADHAVDTRDPPPPQHASTAPARRSFKTILGLTGIVMAYIATQEILLLPGTVQTQINKSLGPKPYSFWAPLTGNVSSIVGWAIGGSISDFHGRKNIMIVGTIVALIGSIICAATDDMWVLLLGSLIGGFGQGFQAQACAILSEVFRKRHRGIVQGFLFISPMPFMIAGELIGTSIMEHSTWRWVYILNIILTAVSGALIFAFYNPPPRENVDHSLRVSSFWHRTQAGLKHFDYVGCFLLLAFVACSALAIAWTGFQVHKWSNSAILVPLIMGFGCLFVLGIWEWKFAHQPLFAPHMFTNIRGYLVLITATSLIAFAESIISSFWGSAIIPSIYAQAALTPDVYTAGRYHLAHNISNVVGGITAGLLMRIIGRTNIQLVVCGFMISLFVGLMATLEPGNIKPGLAYTAIGDFFGGYFKVLVLVMSQLAFGDELIASATGVMNMGRGLGPAYALSFYLTIMNSEVKKNLAKRVAAAVIPLGLPIPSVGPLLMALASQDPTAMMMVPGVSLPIIGAATDATMKTYAAAFRVCYYVGLSVGLLGTCLALFTHDVKPKMDLVRSVDLAENKHIMLSFKPSPHLKGIHNGSAEEVKDETAPV